MALSCWNLKSGRLDSYGPSLAGRGGVTLAVYRLPQPTLLSRVLFLPLGVGGSAGRAEASGIVHLVAFRLLLMPVPLDHWAAAVSAPVGAAGADIVAARRLNEVGGDFNLGDGGELIGSVKVTVTDNARLDDVGGGCPQVLA